MASESEISDQFRQRIRDERERRGWTRHALVDMLAVRGVYVHPTTLAKVETGDRGVRLDMLWALADIFGVSIDTLIGRGGHSSDLAWAASKLTSNAQKAAGDIAAIAHRLQGEYDEVWSMLGQHGRRGPLVMSGAAALAHLRQAREALNKLAGQFPLPVAG